MDSFAVMYSYTNEEYHFRGGMRRRDASSGVRRASANGKTELRLTPFGESVTGVYESVWQQQKQQEKRDIDTVRVPPQQNRHRHCRSDASQRFEFPLNPALSSLVIHLLASSQFFFATTGTKPTSLRLVISVRQ